MNITENYQKILSECQQYNPQIELVAVSKKQPIAKVQSLIDAVPGVILGESFLQEWLEKKKQLTGEYQCHFIGNIQSNKIKQLVGNFSVIESVGRIKEVVKINQVAEAKSLVQDVFLQVNISDDQNKAGFSSDELLERIKEFSSLANLRILGLMTITMQYADEDLLVRDFRKMRVLTDQCSELLEYPLKLSMGMSADYLLAIKSGADIVRIGSKIFGTRE